MEHTEDPDTTQDPAKKKRLQAPKKSAEQQKDAEKVAVAEAIDRLAEKYPNVDRDVITQIVAEEHLSYEGKPVRDFVPVLVEKSAKKRVKQLSKA